MRSMGLIRWMGVLGAAATIAAIGYDGVAVAQTSDGSDSGGSGPNLTQTFDFITRKLSVVRTFPNNGHPFSVKTAGISFDRCSMHFAIQTAQRIKTADGLLRDAGEGDLAEGGPGTEISSTTTGVVLPLADVDPSSATISQAPTGAYVLGFTTKEGRKTVEYTSSAQSGTDSAVYFTFESQDMARRLQNAFVHAIELCVAHPENSPKDVF